MNTPNTMLGGVRILDLSRLAPGPYCTMLLADMGADVIVVGGGRSGLPIETYQRGKKFIELDLKSDAGREAFLALASTADVVIEGFRPGVCDRLGVGYQALVQVNPKLVYCSLTGYGQDGPLAQEAGHDINYVGLSGALGAFGPDCKAPTIPLNLLADFAGGGMHAAFAILGALFERERSGSGQYIDVAMVDGCISLMGMQYQDWGKSVLPERGRGLLTGEAPFYRCYACADGKYVAVGALEDAFFVNLWNGLDYAPPVPAHMDKQTWAAMESRFSETFATRSRDSWVEHFTGRNACVSPVLSPDEVFSHPQVRQRFPDASADNIPAIPRYSRSMTEPGITNNNDQTKAVLRSVGLAEEVIVNAIAEGGQVSTGLRWPPIR